MKGTNDTLVGTISINTLHHLVGGQCTEKGNLLAFKSATLDPRYLNKPFRSAASAVAICTKGWMEVTVDMQARRMSRGAVIIYGPHSIVEFHNCSDDLEIYAVIFTPEIIKETMIDLDSVMPILKYFTEHPGDPMVLDEKEISTLLKFYDLSYDVIEIGKPAIIRDVLTAMVATFGEMYSRRLTGDRHNFTRQQEYFEKFLREVAMHHQNERSVKYYADALHITPKYLSTIIKDISGKSATSWINDFVIQQAKIMLKYSGKSIQEITYEMNFSTQSFFGKYFKRHTGISPSEYRQKK